MTNNTAEILNNLSDNDIVLVPEGLPSKNVGLQIHWRLTGTLDREVFDTALKTVLPEKLLPTDSHDIKYLKRALETLRENRSSNLVRRVDNGKLSMVQETRDLLDLDLIGEHKGAYDVTINASLVKNEDGSQSVKITPEDHPQAQIIRDEFERQRTLYHTGTDISQWLSTRIMPAMHAVNGRDRGGFYFIAPGEDTARFEEIIKVLHSISTFDSRGKLTNGVKIYAIPAVLSKDLAEAVIDSLTDETEQLASEVNAKVEEAELTARGWAGQRRLILDMERKVSKFSQALGVGLEAITEKLHEAQNGIGFIEAKIAYQESLEEEKKV